MSRVTVGVRALLDRYCEAVRTADPVLFASCWAHDAVWDLAGKEVRGATAITAYFAAARGALLACTQDVLADSIVPAPADPNRATARSVIREDQLRERGPGLVVGVYDDDVVHTADGWRFAQRSFDLLWRGTARTPAPLGPDSLVLCSGTLGSAPLVHKACAAASAGFDGLSFYVRELDGAREAGWKDAELRALLAALGLSVAETDGACAWLGSPADPSLPLADLLAAGAAVGARSATIFVPPGVELRTVADLDDAAAALAVAAEQAAVHGLLLHLEPFAWSGLADLGTAGELCRRAAAPCAGLLVDTWHLAVGPDGGRLPEDLAGSDVLAIQLGEAEDTRPLDVRHAARHRRLLPGEGPGANAAALRELRARGCEAPVGVEVFSDDLHGLPPREAATRAAQAARAVLSGA